MTRRKSYLAHQSDCAARRAVTRAQNQFQELSDLSIPEALKQARSLPDSEIFIEAIAIGSSNQDAALKRLESYFYVKQVLDAFRQLTSEARFICEQIARVALHPIKRWHVASPIQGDSKPVAPRSLGKELDLMLKTIRAAHAPTAAIPAASLSI